MSVTLPGTIGRSPTSSRWKLTSSDPTGTGCSGSMPWRTRAERIGDPDAAALQAHQHHPVEAVVALDDLVGDASERPTDVVGTEHGALRHGGGPFTYGPHRTHFTFDGMLPAPDHRLPGLNGRMARLFVAVWPSEDAVAALTELRRKDQRGVRFVSPENWHVTLRFLGEADTDEVIGALDDAVLPPAVARLGPAVDVLSDRALVVPVAGLDDLADVVRDTDRASRSDVAAPLRRPPHRRPGQAQGADAGDAGDDGARRVRGARGRPRAQPPRPRRSPLHHRPHLAHP